MARERGDHGYFAEDIPLEAVRQVFHQRTDHAEPLGARDVADVLDCSHRTAFNKLDELSGRGDLESRKPSANLRVWWVPIEGEQPPQIADRLGDDTGVGPDTVDEILDTVGEKITGYSDETVRERATDVLTAYRYLKAEAPATVEEIQANTYEDAAETDLGSDENRWVNYLREPLSALPGVVWGGSRAAQWAYVAPTGLLARQLAVDIDDRIYEIEECAGDTRQAQHKRAMAQLALNHLAEAGEARKADFKATLPDYTINYDDFTGLWVYVIRPAFKELDTVDSSSRGKFRYVGDSDA